MRYKVFIFSLILIVCVLAWLNKDRYLANKILNISDFVKISFLNITESIGNAYDRHFNQAELIISLQNKVVDYDKILLEKQMLQNDNQKLKDIINKGGITHTYPEIHIGKIFSYTALGEDSKVWIDSDLNAFKDYKDNEEIMQDRIFGLVKDNVAVGVVVYQNGRLQGFLNGDEECNYGVYIGESRHLGIASGSKEGLLNIKYISEYADIKEGDKVYTSGLDGIFLENIPVGVISSITHDKGYIIASVKPFTKVDSLSYVWIIDREPLKQESSEIESN